MTAIALVTHAKSEYTAMLADSLITNSIQVRGDIRLFGRGRVKPPKTDRGDYFEYFEQKLNILGPDLAFCWSGERWLALDFAIKLDGIYTSDYYSVNEIELFFETWVNGLSLEVRPLIAIICIAASEGRNVQLIHNVPEFGPFDQFSRARVSGSGWKIVLGNLSDSRFEAVTVPDSKHLMMNVLCGMYYDDIVRVDHQGDGVGGFFELADIEYGKIRKLSDILFTTISIDARDPKQIWMIRNFGLKQDSYEGMTIIREFYVDYQSGKPPVQMATHIAHSIVPRIANATFPRGVEILNQTATDVPKYFFDACPAGDFDATHSLVQLTIHDGKNQFEIPIYQYSESRNPLLRVIYANGKPEFVVSQKLRETVLRIAEKAIDKKHGCLRNVERR